jgi:hypothetical protein
MATRRNNKSCWDNVVRVGRLLVAIADEIAKLIELSRHLR